MAAVTTEETKVGRQSLVIQHRSERKEGAYSSTEQMIPIPANATSIRVSCWAKGRDVKEDAVFLAVGNDHNNRTVKLPSGTTDWQQLEATFPIDDFAGRDMKFSIVSQDTATAWLDELVLDVTE